MKTLKIVLGGLNNLPSKEDCKPAEKCKDTSHFFNPDKYGHMVVNTIEELHMIPCKMRQPGMTVTVVEEDYSEWILKPTTTTGVCDNNNWHVAETGGLWKYVPIQEEREEDGDYIENLQGTSARLKEDYSIKHPRDLITKEYYENNLPEQEPPELTEAITADLTVGGINEEAVLPEGMTFQEFAETLLTKIYYPTFTNPSFSLSNNAGNREVGESIDVTYTRSFSRGQITLKGKVIGDYTGPVSNVTIDGTVTAAASIVIPKVVALGTNSISGSALFAAGPGLYDSKGNFYSDGYKGGTLTATTSFTGYYARFYGATDGNKTPRTLTKELQTANTATITLQSGTVEKMFEVYLPSGRTISEVVDLDALNANITAEYKNLGIIQVPDAGGTNRNYTKYRLTLDMPYSTNHRHQIKIA